LVAHIVLFRPKAGLAAEDRESLVAAIERAHREIAVIRRFLVGKRTQRGAGYAAAMPEYPFIAVIELEDEMALQQYLSHPAHEGLARLFWQTSDSALAYDFALVEPSSARTLLA
jgi:hypothetical protein